MPAGSNSKHVDSSILWTLLEFRQIAEKGRGYTKTSLWITAVEELKDHFPRLRKDLKKARLNLNQWELIIQYIFTECGRPYFSYDYPTEAKIFLSMMEKSLRKALPQNGTFPIELRKKYTDSCHFREFELWHKGELLLSSKKEYVGPDYDL